MVGEWMMDPIKIPWFRHPGPSWSLVYLVRGGSRPNLTEGSLSAAMGFDAVGEHTGAGHNHNIVMPFGGESPGSEGPKQNFGSFPASPRLGEISGVWASRHVREKRVRRRTGFPSHRAGEERV
ncbi:hypothetical protein M5K25_009532 [Dendrobium thyrsiflorum]|uniref:Uncharacterized protein n=1 Tax=Dendrobium thyrsiflorum TaxID=117978 RepID=A0ABD0VCS6_DENTH